MYFPVSLFLIMINLFFRQKSNKNDKNKDGKLWNNSGKDENMDVDDSTASGAESSLSPSEAPDAPQDTEDSTGSDLTPRVNPLEWTVSFYFMSKESLILESFYRPFIVSS